jgi:uncharacterized protein YheU (UPF0270 family)
MMELDTPDPEKADPDTPERVTPEPDTGEPDTGEPDTGEPATPERDTPEPDIADPDPLETNALEAVVVAHTELSPELLHAVVESFVLREGTDYGEREFSLAEKVVRVIAQLKRGEAQIVYDLGSASLTILNK